MANLDDVYMGTAFLHARKSKAVRAQVGAVIVTKTGVLIPGYNGTPSGTNNVCEDENNKTKPEVIHAELNCVLKAAREGISIAGCKVYVTHSPCLSCAALLIQAGVGEVIYNQIYRSADGVNYLANAGITHRALAI